MSTIQELKETLKKGKKIDRVRSAHSLGDLGVDGASAVPDLITALEDNDIDVRLRVTIALGNIGQPARDAIPYLFNKVLNGDDCKYLASISIGLIGKKGFEFVLKSFQGADYSKAIAAAFCLYNIGYKQNTMGDHDEYQRVLNVAIKISNDESSLLGHAATLVVGSILSNEEMVKYIDLERINSRILGLLSYPSFHLTLTATVTLGAMGVSTLPSVPYLIQAVLDDTWWAPFAAEALKNIEELMLDQGIDIMDGNRMGKMLQGKTISELKKSINEMPICYSKKLVTSYAKERGLELSKKSTADGIDVIGVYKIPAREPCALVEVKICGAKSKLDVGKFSQVSKTHQVAYDERILDEEGVRELEIRRLTWPNNDNDARWIGDVRLIFFLHYLDSVKPLNTPLGPKNLPKPTKLPARLSFIKYKEP